MPVITIALGQTEAAVKAELIRGLTETAVQATKIPADKFIVLVDELADDNIGLGGRTLSQVKASLAKA